MTTNNDYDIEQCKHQTEINRFNRRVWVEPVLIFISIFAAFSLLGHTQQQDEQIKQADAEKAYKSTCQIAQKNTVHQFNCRVISAKLAVIK